MPFSESTEWVTGLKGTSFFTKRWIPTETPKAKVVFVHGCVGLPRARAPSSDQGTAHSFIEHVLRYDHVFSRFADQGIEVFGFDQRGFGQTAAKTKSQGKTSWKEQFDDIDYFLSKEAKVPDGRKVFLIGHSMVGPACPPCPVPSTRADEGSSHRQGGGLAFGFFTRPRPFPTASLVTGGVIVSAPLIQQTPAVATSGLIIRLGSFVGAVLPKLTLQVVRGDDFAKVGSADGSPPRPAPFADRSASPPRYEARLRTRLVWG